MSASGSTSPTAFTDGKPRIRRRRPLFRLLGVAGATVLLLFYLVQNARLTPNSTDGGLILTYVDDMAHGKWPHHDFIDAYGPLNWPGVVLSYVLAGNSEWGIRLWLIFVKLVIIGTSYLLVCRLANAFYATVTAALMTLLFGQAWQSLQEPYGFTHVVPLVFGTWYFVLCGSFKRSTTNLVVAGLLSAAAIWTKINAGLFLVAGALFALLYWSDAAPGARASQSPAWVAFVFKRARSAGLVVLPVVFFLYIRQYLDAWYVAYLVAPVSIGVVFTWRDRSRQAVDESGAALRLRACAVYLGVTLGASALVLVLFTGPTGMVEYFHNLSNIVGYLHYRLPFSRLGVPGPYVGLNENYWLQLSWLLSLVFLAWAILGWGKRSREVYGGDADRKKGVAVSLFVFSALYQFVMYSRSDETHVFEGLVVIPPALTVLLSQIEELVSKTSRKAHVAFRSSVAVPAALWGSTLFVTPGVEVFDLSTGDHAHPALKYLVFRPENNPYMWDYSANISDNEWDQVVDEAASYIDRVTPDGSTILVFDANRIIHLLSNTRPVGGRYHFYFYMVSTELFKREGFDKAVPPRVLQEILENPPLVAVSAIARVPPIALEFPELRRMVAEKYTLTARFRHYLVYELKPEYRGSRPSHVGAERHVHDG